MGTQRSPRASRILPALVLSAVFIAGCGGGGENDGETTCSQQYWNGEVGVCLPAGWEVLSRETLDDRGVPQDVIAAFQTEKPVAGQYPTVTVTRETLASPITGPEYSKASIRSVSALPGYRLIDAKPVTIEGQEVEIHIFSAQPITEDPERRFYQVSAVTQSGGYTITGLTPLSVTSALDRDITNTVRSLRFTDPELASEEEAE